MLSSSVSKHKCALFVLAKVHLQMQQWYIHASKAHPRLLGHLLNQWSMSWETYDLHETLAPFFPS